MNIPLKIVTQCKIFLILAIHAYAGERPISPLLVSGQRGLAVLVKDSLPIQDVQVENIIMGEFTRFSFKLKA